MNTLQRLLTIVAIICLVLALLIANARAQQQLLPPRGQSCVVEAPDASYWFHTIICGYADGEGGVWTHRKAISGAQVQALLVQLRPIITNNSTTTPLSLDWLRVGWVPSDKCVDGPRVWPNVRYVPGCIP